PLRQRLDGFSSVLNEVAPIAHISVGRFSVGHDQQEPAEGLLLRQLVTCVAERRSDAGRQSTECCGRAASVLSAGLEGRGGAAGPNIGMFRVKARSLLTRRN